VGGDKQASAVTPDVTGSGVLAWPSGYRSAGSFERIEAWNIFSRPDLGCPRRLV